MRKHCNIYAAYRGDTYIGEGTLHELSSLLKCKESYLSWARCPSAKKRYEKHKQFRRVVLVPVD